jgi:hypothetical protein
MPCCFDNPPGSSQGYSGWAINLKPGRRNYYLYVIGVEIYSAGFFMHTGDVFKWER